MDSLLKPERLSADPNSPTADKEYRHWLRTFENFVTGIQTSNKEIDKPKHRKYSTKLILGIETTFDDTGVAIVDNSKNVRGQALSLQKIEHIVHGGVHPQIAQAMHKKHLPTLLERVMLQSGLNFRDLDAVATATCPGLPYCLQEGLNFTKDLVNKHSLPFIPVHHLEAHLLTIRMIEKLEFPFLNLLVSGGNCFLYLATSLGDYKILGQTYDEPPGAVFDKVARKIVGNKNSNGNITTGKDLENIAKLGNISNVKLNRPLSREISCNFSFSGLQSRVMQFIDDKTYSKEDIAAAFQDVLISHIVNRTHRAIIYCQENKLLNIQCPTLVVSGGVACNNELYLALKNLCEATNTSLLRPPIHLCTDNGVMIAWAGMEYLLEGKGFSPNPQTEKYEPKAVLGQDIRGRVMEASIKLPKVTKKFATNLMQSRNYSTKLILGIESTFDDTGVAVVDSNRNIRSQTLSSHSCTSEHVIDQAKTQLLHRKYLPILVNEAMEKAGICFNDLDAVATAVKPGLPFALKEGLDFTKNLVELHNLPFIPVHHLEAHLLTIRMIERLEFPFLNLLVTGGNCILCLAKELGNYKILGQTLDKPPGAVFDRIAREIIEEKQKRIFNGEDIEKLASTGDRTKVQLTEPLLNEKQRSCDFSFSGLETQVLRHIKSNKYKRNDIAASFQDVISNHIVKKVHRALIFCQQNNLMACPNSTLVVSGGVACNNKLYLALKNLCEATNTSLLRPPIHLCTDNGVMIAWAGMEYFLKGMGISKDPQSEIFTHKAPLGENISEELKGNHIYVRTKNYNKSITK